MIHDDKCQLKQKLYELEFHINNLKDERQWNGVGSTNLDYFNEQVVHILAAIIEKLDRIIE